MPRIERLSSVSGPSVQTNERAEVRSTSLLPMQPVLDDTKQYIQSAFRRAVEAALDLKYSGQLDDQEELGEKLSDLVQFMDHQFQQAEDWRKMLDDIQGSGLMDENPDFEFSEERKRSEFEKEYRLYVDQESVLEGLQDQGQSSTARAPETEDDNEDDIEMVGETQTYRCPITQSMLVEPYRSRVCGHSYEKNAIKTMLARNPMQRCPVGACSRPLTVNDLYLDIGLQRKLKRMNTKTKK